MTGQIQKEIFEVRLPYFDLVKIANVWCQSLQAVANVDADDLDDATGLEYGVFYSGEVIGQIGDR